MCTIHGFNKSDLESEAVDALKLLEEDGTTSVFPPMVEQLRDELHGVADRLRKEETGAGTNAAQKDVEDLLGLLINALRKTIELKEGGGSCNCNGGLPAEQRSGAAAAATTQELSQKQARVRDLMRRLAVKMGKENDAEEGR